MAYFGKPRWISPFKLKMVAAVTDLKERYAEVGAAIDAGMNQRALTQADLARAAEISDTVIRRLQRGEVGNYRRSTLAKIGMALWDDAGILTSIIDGDAPPAGASSWIDAIKIGSYARRTAAPPADADIEIAALIGRLDDDQLALLKGVLRSILSKED